MVELQIDAAPAGDAAIVLFDGVCNLCNASVQFIIQRDPDGRFVFASLQSAIGMRILREHGLAADELHSVILVDNGRAYSRSDAALRITSRLRGFWPAVAVFRIVPRPVRDLFYDWIAENRYRWFGRRSECMVPSPELRQRFLE